MFSQYYTHMLVYFTCALEIISGLLLLTDEKGCRVKLPIWFLDECKSAVTVQLCCNGLSNWAGSDTMQIFEAGLAANLCTVMLWAGTSTMHK